MFGKTVSLLMGLGFFVALATPAHAGPNCHCRTSTGQKINVGGFTCLKTNTGLMEAQCDFVLNNTAWKLTGNSCPSANYFEKGGKPAFNVAKIDFKNAK